MINIINKRILFTFMTSITISGFVVICTLGQSLRQQKIEAKMSNTVQELENPGYMVRIYGDKLGVFRGESARPFKIIDCRVNMLSDYDREMLYEGIMLETDAELNAFIEDITT